MNNMRTTLEGKLRDARPIPPGPRDAAVGFARFLAFTAAEEGGQRPRKRGTSLSLGRFMPRPGVVFAAAALAGLAAATVAASSRDWWFFQASELRPTSQPVVVASSAGGESRLARMSGRAFQSGGEIAGRSAGVPWEFTAFTAEHPGGGSELCYGVTPNPPNPRGEGAAAGCGATTYPGPGHSKDPEYDSHWLGYLDQVPGETAKATVQFFSGPTAPNVTRVDLILGYSHPISVPTIAAPPGLDVPVRFFVAVLPPNEVVRALIPRDQRGEALEHWNLS
jgi:hypothetical protein